MGLISTVVTVGAGMGVDNAASAAEIGTQQNPIAVVGAGGKWDRACFTSDMSLGTAPVLVVVPLF